MIRNEDLEATIVGKCVVMAPLLDERARRLWAAAESIAIGYGGEALVSAATGLARETIRHGQRELVESGEWACGNRACQQKARGMLIIILSLVMMVGSALLNCGCQKSLTVPVPNTVVILTAGESQSPLIEQLAEMYDRAPVPFTLKLRRLPTSAGRGALERGDADLMLIAADRAYFAYRDSAEQNGKPSHIRAMATLQVAPLYLITRPEIRSVTDLQGRAIGSDILSPLIELLLAAFDVRPSAGKLQLVGRTDAIRRLGEGTLDAAFVAAGGPSPFVEAVVRGGARLLPIEGPVIDRFRRDYPFVRLVSIPAGTYVDQTQPVHTIGVEVVYVCRSDLSEDLVYGLTKRLFEVLPALSQQSYELRRVDVKHASSTPIPLHEGAARYYREVELMP